MNPQTDEKQSLTATGLQKQSKLPLKLHLWNSNVNIEQSLRITRTRISDKGQRLYLENGMRFNKGSQEMVYLMAQTCSVQNGLYQIQLVNKLIPQVRLVRVQ